jgi:hypothetical protein
MDFGRGFDSRRLHQQSIFIFNDLANFIDPCTSSVPFTSRRFKGCGCPIWVQGWLDGVPVRQSLDLTNWEAAQRRLRDWEIHGKENALTLKEALERFIADAGE